MPSDDVRIDDALQVNEALADEVAALLVDTGRLPWYAALQLGHHLSTPELRYLVDLLRERIHKCRQCRWRWTKLTWDDPCRKCRRKNRRGW